jgi:ribA/ribD-fused uncharacterized protein
MKTFSGKKAFLSNFYRDQEGFCVEHRYQAAKAANDGDRDWILSAKTPGEAKRRGRVIQKWDKFEENKFDIMLNLVRQKFANSELQQMLLDTENEELVEGNNWGDTYWGVCNGVGENHLGKILMQVRQEIRDEKPHS